MYIIREHVCSMCLADALKVLLKNIPLMETIISTAASQSKNDITEVSVNILNRNNCSNFLHRCQVVNTSNASFNQMHSHRWTDDNIRWSAFGRAIVVSSILAVDAGVFIVTQYFICITINACEGIALRKQSWRIFYNIVQIFISFWSSVGIIWRIIDVQLSIWRCVALNWE